MPKNPLWITTTSDLTDDEVAIVNAELDTIALDTGIRIAQYFLSNGSNHCYNIRRGQKAEWNRFWAAIKTRLYSERLRSENATTDI